jgi:predicted FMN-binding regulatory protein PaiB
MNQFNGLPEAYKEAMYKEIVGIEIEVTNIEAKFKISQNKFDLFDFIKFTTYTVVLL